MKKQVLSALKTYLPELSTQPVYLCYSVSIICVLMQSFACIAFFWKTHWGTKPVANVHSIWETNLLLGSVYCEHEACTVKHLQEDSCSSDTHFTCEPSIHWHWGWYCFSSSNNETQLTVCRWLRAYSHSGQYHYACSSQFSTNAKRLLSAHICVMLQCFMSAAQHSTAQHFRQHPTLHDGAMTFLQDGMAWALLKTDLHLVAGLQIPLHVLHLFSQPLMLTLQVPHLCITTKRLWPLSLTAVLAADV